MDKNNKPNKVNNISFVVGERMYKEINEWIKKYEEKGDHSDEIVGWYGSIPVYKENIKNLVTNRYED